MLMCLAAALLAPQVTLWVTRGAPFERMGLRAVPVGDQVALIGGFDYASRKCLRDVGFLDQDAQEHASPLKLAVGRNHFEAVSLDSRRILVIGGYSEDFDTLAEVECLDFKRRSVEAWPWLIHPVELFSAVRLRDKVAIIGGLTSQGQTETHDSIQLIDLKSREVSQSSAKLTTSRFGQDAVWLPELKKVVIAGGKHVERKDGKAVYRAVSTVELWDPLTDKVESGGEMTMARDRPRLFQLPSGKVLIIGGADDAGSMDTIELYDPQTKSAQVVAKMAAPRMAASILPWKGKGLMICGGWTSNAKAAAQIEYLDFETLKTSVVGTARTSRAENAIVWLKGDKFALLGGKDAFEGRNPHSYSYRETELFKVEDPGRLR